MFYLNNRETSEYFADSHCVENFNVLNHDLFFAICSFCKVTPNLLLYTHFLEALYLYLLGNASWKTGRKKYTYTDVENGVHCQGEKTRDDAIVTGSIIGENEVSPNWADYVYANSRVMHTALKELYAAYCKKRRTVARDVPNLTVYYRILVTEILNLLPINITQTAYEVGLMRNLLLFCFYNSSLSRMSIEETRTIWSDTNFSYIPLLPVDLNC